LLGFFTIRITIFCVTRHVRNAFGEDYVGYAVGGSENPNPKATLQYYTDAPFMGKAMAQEDFSGFALVVIDEVHERFCLLL